jgi:hypothetical protein
MEEAFASCCRLILLEPPLSTFLTSLLVFLLFWGCPMVQLFNTSLRYWGGGEGGAK